MNCRLVEEQLCDLLDQTESSGPEVREHLQKCAACRARLLEQQSTLATVRPKLRVAASEQFAARTMKAIAAEHQREMSAKHRKSNWADWPRWIAAAAASMLLLVVVPSLPFWSRVATRSGIAVLNQSVSAMSQVKAIHIRGRVRSIPGDSFDLVGPQYPFVPLEMWREYSPERWRVEKPGRVAVMDGDSSILYVGTAGWAARGTPRTGFVGWLEPLLRPETVLRAELEAAKTGNTELAVRKTSERITLETRSHAEGDFTNPWAKNKSIAASDHTCLYEFDANTNRLLRMEVKVRTEGRETTVLELSEFQYTDAIDANLFSLQIPASAQWHIDASKMRGTTGPITGPKEAASYFFSAASHNNWEAVLSVYPASGLSESFKRRYGALQVVSIGKAFRSGPYAGYYVPYEIRLQDGSIQSFNLAVRNDNPEKRWVVDGGL